MSGRQCPRRVLRQAAPIEGQSLIGLVRACAWDNRLPSTGALLRDCIETDHAWGNLALRDDLDAERLAFAMRLEADEVAGRAHPARTIARDLTVRSFFSADVRSYDLRPSLRAFAPSSLEESGHHRAMWHHALLPFCLETGQMLTHRCGRCGNVLRWGAAKPLTRCSHCGRPAVPTEDRVDHRMLAAAQLVFGPLDPRSAARAEATKRLHADLAALPPGVATDLAWALGRLAVRSPVGRRAQDRALAPEARCAIISAGADMIAGWPDSIVSSLRDASRRGSVESRQMQAGLKALVDPVRAWPAQRALLLARVPELLGSARKALGHAHGRTLSARSTLERLRMAADRLPAVVSAGGVEAVGATQARYLCAVFDEASVLRLAALRRDSASFAHASEITGISHAGIGDLVRGGQLDEHAGPVIASMYADRQLSRSSVDRLIERIEDGSHADIGYDETLPLSRVASGFGGGYKPWARIFTALLNGSIPYLLKGPGSENAIGTGRIRPSRLIDRLQVRHADLLRVGAQRPDGVSARECAKAMSRRDAEELLNVTPGQLGQILKDELRDAIFEDGRLSSAAVLALARSRISPAEISIRFASGGRAIPRQIRSAGVARLGPSGWSRRAVEAAMTEDGGK